MAQSVRGAIVAFNQTSLHRNLQQNWRPRRGPPKTDDLMQKLTLKWSAAARASIRFNQHDAGAWQKLGTSLAHSGQFAEALESLNQAIAVHEPGELPNLLASLSIIYQKMGKLDLAETCLVDALAERPGDFGLIAQLAALQSSRRCVFSQN